MTLRPEPYSELENDATYAAIDRFRSLADTYEISMGGLALAWAKSHPDVTSVLAGPRSLEQFKAVEEAISLHLDSADRVRIRHEVSGRTQTGPSA
jgi:aryl-alcohol dehydrogenase-like predicted oxidoreductase